MPVLDPFEKPPGDLLQAFKRYRRVSAIDLGDDAQVVDFSRSPCTATFELVKPLQSIENIDHEFPYTSMPSHYASKQVPGLVIVPSLVPIHTQRWLLDRLLHRDLANPAHLTNLHKHYIVPYNLTDPVKSCSDPHRSEPSPERIASFFNVSPSSTATFQPLDPDIHKPLPVPQALRQKLRWATLGGQYDWTEKRYPDGVPPQFPPDVATLVKDWFPEINCEAAIVNVYSPGDTLSLHRDVSEHCDQGLVSISIGCEALFLVGIRNAVEQRSRYHILRLRSGDAVYMSGAARFAWHGVPLILSASCPLSLQSWPANEDETSAGQFEAWRSWMAEKRVNLNIRQMFDA